MRATLRWWTGRVSRRALGSLAVTAAISVGAAAAEPSPQGSCDIKGNDTASFTSLDAMAPAIGVELGRRMAVPGASAPTPVMAPRDAAWQVTDVVTEPLPGRRFILGGRTGSRWYVWYESGGVAHLYHLAIFDLPDAAAAPAVIAHVVAALDELCPMTRALLQAPGTGDEGLIAKFW